MKRKMLVVLGSPRKDGYSTYLATQAAMELESGGCDVEILKLRGMDIQPCIACDKCQDGQGKYCRLKDDMAGVYAKIAAADGLLIACPIYWFNINAKTKLFIDRFYAFDSKKTGALKGKKIGIILSYGDDDPYLSGAVNAIRSLEDSFKYTESDIRGIVYGTEVEAAMRGGDAKMKKEIADLAARMVE